MSAFEPLLVAEGVGRSFGRLEVLKSASLWAEAGKITTLMGRNGSGKTTLIRIAVGELRPDYGSLAFMGERSARHSVEALARRGLMFVPQPGLLSPAWTVRQHFQALARALGLPDPAPSIERMEIGELLDQRAASLSGGEKSRVSFALVHARQPKVLVADEPLVGLVEVEDFDHPRDLPSAPSSPEAIDAGEEGGVLGHGRVAVERELLRHVADARPRLRPVPRQVKAGDPRPPRGRP